MKTIKLTQGKVTIVNNDVFEWASKFKWCALNTAVGRYYAIRFSTRKEKFTPRRLLFLHREIMKPEEDFQVDHIDGNSLNNCRKNLRVVTRRQNGQNRKIGSNNTSGYKGVCSTGNAKKPWYAQLQTDEKTICIGRFASKTDAALAYDAAAIKHFGEFAKLNFPTNTAKKRRIYKR